MNFPRTMLARAAYLAAPLAVAVITFAACGNDRPKGADDGTNPSAAPLYCATPQEGCECIEPGMLAECGTVTNRSGDYVQCSMGHRQCIGGRWGACIGEQDVTRKTFTAGGGLGTRALGAGAPCGSDGGGPSNACDPYCNAFVDDPNGVDGGGVLVYGDGGLTIPPTGDAGIDASAPGPFTSTNSGKSACAPVANNVVAATCVPGTPAALTSCQQDHHCDIFTSKCLWNGGTGFTDPLAAGIDLTLGAPCGPGGSPTSQAIVCNRGTAPAPAGSPIHFWQTTGPTAPNACTNLGAPTYVFALAANLIPGACVNFTVPNTAGAKFLTLNAGLPGAQPVNEGAGRCANNSAYWRTDGTPGCADCIACNTQLSGKVYDPSGLTNNVPLSGVSVFQPSGALLTFGSGVACDTCNSLSSPAQTLAVTDAAGAFTLDNVSPGATVPIVVQSGRWRRMVNVNIANACAPNPPSATIPNGTFRMPKNRTEGDIPKIAMVMGEAESLECFLRKVGIDATEIARRTGAADAHRIQLYRTDGMGTTAGPAPLASTLWGAAGSINEYTAIIQGCNLASGANVAADRTRIKAYTDIGGRLFVDHWAMEDNIRNGPAAFAATSTWQNSTNPTPGAIQGKILTATPPQVTLRDWMFNVGASTDWGSGYMKSDEPKKMSLLPSAASATQWIRGEDNNNWGTDPTGDFSLSYSFETPIGGNCGVPTGTGRVLVNGMHVSQGRVTGAPYPIPNTKIFPTDCALGSGLSSEEKYLEFQFFQLTACQLGGATPPVVIPPPPLPVVDFTRDYVGVCGPGEQVKWGPFYWQANIPASTSITFRAATAATLAALPASPPAAAPTTALVGTAAATVTSPTWDCNGCAGAPVSVDSQLRAQTSTPSKDYLRVYMRFQPTATVSPTLTQWRQIYDCIPAE